MRLSCVHLSVSVDFSRNAEHLFLRILAPANRFPLCELMNTKDITGRNSSFLTSEESYLYVREMQRKNLIVPLVGDFGGPP
jgi:hypothetical protein